MVLAMSEAEASATTPPAPARKVRVQKPDHPAFPRGGHTNKQQPVAHEFFADERRRSVGAALRGGVHRTVCCADALAWLRDRRLPRRCHIVCSPPDIGELKPISVAEYTAWFVEAVRAVLAALEPSAVALFYVTDGRRSGPDETYLDKSHLCHRGAEAAGAACLFHRIVLGGPAGVARAGSTRPSYAHLLAFSVALRPPRDALVWSDVVPTRGHMAYMGATGERACAEAIEFVLGNLRGGTLQPDVRTSLLHEALSWHDTPAYVEIYFDKGTGHFPTDEDEVCTPYLLLNRSLMRQNPYSQL